MFYSVLLRYSELGTNIEESKRLQSVLPSSAPILQLLTLCLISDKLSPNSTLNHSSLHPRRQWPSLLGPCLPFPSFGPSIFSFPYRTSTKRVTSEDMSYSCQITVQSHIYYNYQKNLCSSSDGHTSKPRVTEKPGVTGKPGGGQTPSQVDSRVGRCLFF